MSHFRPLINPKNHSSFQPLPLKHHTLPPNLQPKGADLESLAVLRNEDGFGVKMLLKKCCVSDFKINERAYYKLKTLIEQRRSFFILRQKLASFVNGNENEASAALFLKHERSFATGFLSGLSYKKSCQEKSGIS